MLNQELQESLNYACGMLISIFSKDESNFICKGYQTILDRNLSIIIFRRIKKKLKRHVIFLLSNQNKAFLFFCFAIQWHYYIRAVGSFFMVRGEGRGEAEWKCRSPWLTKDEKKKKNWLKRPKAFRQKTKLGPKYKWFKISYL